VSRRRFAIAVEPLHKRRPQQARGAPTSVTDVICIS
jgi:hypothetical protein